MPFHWLLIINAWVASSPVPWQLPHLLQQALAGHPAPLPQGCASVRRQPWGLESWGRRLLPGCVLRLLEIALHVTHLPLPPGEEQDDNAAVPALLPAPVWAGVGKGHGQGPGTRGMSGVFGSLPAAGG